MIQQLRRGAGSLRHLPEMLEKLGIHKPMAVCARSQLERLNDCLGTIPHAVFTGYHPNPDFQDCATGRDLYLAENCDGLISLGGGSLSNYVGSMAAKSMQNITFSVLPAAGFTGTVADITVNMTGTGAISGKAVSSTTAISVPISQPDRFEVGQLQLSSESIMVGDTGSVTLSYVNKGKNAIGNLEARLTGTNLGGENYQYLGNLNAGTEGSVDFDITPDAAGNISGVITLNYEDASGNPRTISKDFTATAEEMNYDDYMPDPDSNMDEPQQTGMPVWGWVLIVVCVGVVVAVIVVVVLRKRKKAKALAALDEDSDEDI